MTHKLTIPEIAGIVELCAYKPDWKINLETSDRGMYIQLQNTAGVCSVTRQPKPWVSGKRYLSEWMCSQEIVGAVFSLIKDAELHEVHEWFRYKGACIYNPHLSPDALADLARRKESFVVRTDSMEKA